MPLKIELPKGTLVPAHIAVILDGNGRWARAHSLPVNKGHEAGAEAIIRIIKTARDLNVHTLTIWGFSTENWKRPPKEVAKIMQLVKLTIERELKNAAEEGVRFVHLGRKDRMPRPLVKLIIKAEEETKNNKKYILNLALDYGGRDELLRAFKKIVEDKVPAKKINEKLVSSYLDTSNQPHPSPDLFIRTSGELRTSGYLPWQMVYTEFYFEADHLPDMTADNLVKAILDYSRRRRRIGGKDKMGHLKFKPELAAKFELNWWRLANIPEETKFRDYAIAHIAEQWGLSKALASQAAAHFILGLKESNKKNWKQSAKSLSQFYSLIKEEVKLAFEPNLIASLEVKILQQLKNGSSEASAQEVEDTTKRLVSEVYRLSDFQAKKAAHLRSMATIERKMALDGKGEIHWENAERYLAAYYTALKDRVA